MGVVVCVTGFRGMDGGFRGNGGASRTSSCRSFSSAGLGPVELRIGFGAGISISCLAFIHSLSLLDTEEGLEVLCCARKDSLSSRTGGRSVASRAAICCGVGDRTEDLRSLRSGSGTELMLFSFLWFCPLCREFGTGEVAPNIPILSLTDPTSGGGLESASEETASLRWP